MSKLYKLVIASIVAISFATVSAIAFEGFSVGIVGNASDFDTTGSETEGAYLSASATANEVTSTSHSKSVEFPSIFIEYTAASSGPFGITFGIEHIPGVTEIGSKIRSDTVSDVKETSVDTGDYTARAEISKHTAIYLEPTFMANDNFGFYVKGGITAVEVKTRELIAVGTDSSSYDDETVFGAITGIGVKGVFGPGLLFKLEATQTQYGELELKSSTGNQNTVRADPEQSSVRIAIGYNF